MHCWGWQLWRQGDYRWKDLLPIHRLSIASISRHCAMAMTEMTTMMVIGLSWRERCAVGKSFWCISGFILVNPRGSAALVAVNFTYRWMLPPPFIMQLAGNCIRSWWNHFTNGYRNVHRQNTTHVASHSSTSSCMRCHMVRPFNLPIQQNPSKSILRGYRTSKGDDKYLK